MKEEELRLLTTDQLLMQMMRLTTAVIGMHKQEEDEKIVDEHLEEIKLIQRIMLEKRANDPG